MSCFKKYFAMILSKEAQPLLSSRGASLTFVLHIAEIKQQRYTNN